jgi:hypothetical protein
MLAVAGSARSGLLIGVRSLYRRRRPVPVPLVAHRKWWPGAPGPEEGAPV